MGDQPNVLETSASADGDDEALFVRFQRGEAAAFERLVERYQTPLTNFAYRLTFDYELACDVVQTSFLEVIRWGRAQVGGEPLKRFRRLLYRIAHRQSVDAIRRARVRRARSLDDATVGATDNGDGPVRQQLASRLASGEPGPAERTLASEEAALLRRYVAELPPDSREALVLRFFEGLSFAEIAQILDCREGTARQRVQYALALLRKSLGLEVEHPQQKSGKDGKCSATMGMFLLVAALFLNV